MKRNRRKIKQINNIVIYYVPLYENYVCVSPDGRYLEEFSELTEAEKWCSEIKDFCGRVVK
ncbi:MAG: hypothetical protein IJA34_00680 [Lachnospiraceae bacterium]|nr:hypothetical protein [Lachnospiraceae bacterium]